MDNLLPLSLMIIIPLTNIAYWLLNNPSRGVHYLIIDIDKSIPFIKLFAIPYLMWQPFTFLTLVYLCLYYRKVYYKVLSNLIIGMIICYIIYYFFETAVPRPELYGNDFLTNLVRFIYSMDQPFNCFPSIHVLGCYTMIKGVKEISDKISIDKIVITLVSIIIILSTQFIKQHVILDLIFAIILADGTYRIISNVSLQKSFIKVSKQCWWLMKKGSTSKDI